MFFKAYLFKLWFVGHIDIVRYLLEREVDPNEQAHCGATALFFAAECGHLEVVKDLLKYGARLIPTNHGLFLQLYQFIIIFSI